MSAMFRFPQIYRVGVASAGNYDQRMYENSWTERYYGLYQEELYGQGDITRLAGNLRENCFWPAAPGRQCEHVPDPAALRPVDPLQ